MSLLAAAGLAAPGPARAAPVRVPVPALAGALVEPNVGQFTPDVRFRARIAGVPVQFRTHGLTLAAPQAGPPVTVGFVGAGPGVQVSGIGRTPTVVNYLLGDAARWRTRVPTYGGVRYDGLWPGVTLDYGTPRGRLKGTYTVAPGARPGAIRWRYGGAAVRLAGDTLAVTPAGSAAVLTEAAPVAWQDGPAGRTLVPVRYDVRADRTVGFRLGRYDTRRPLVVDPELAWSRVLGSLWASTDVTAVAVGGGNEIVATGSTGPVLLDPELPADGMQREYAGDADSWVGKLAADGSHFRWLTYLGGAKDDMVFSLAVDRAGRIGFGGVTTSADFPTYRPVQRRDDRFDSADPNVRDAMAGVLTPDGARFVYSTYLSSPGSDKVVTVQFDPAGRLTVAGASHAIGADPQKRKVEPTRGALRAPVSAGFVTRFGPTGQVLWTATVGASRRTTPAQHELGDTDITLFYGMAVDDRGDVYVVGSTASPYAIVTPGVVQPRRRSGAGYEGYAVKISADGRRLLWGTYLGGSGDEFFAAIGVDRARHVYLYAQTDSTDFPRVRPLQPSCAVAGTVMPDRNRDVAIAKLTPDARRLVYSTCVGGTGHETVDIEIYYDDPPADFVVDPDGNAYLFGETDSLDFPVRDNWQEYAGPAPGFNDCFVVKVAPDGKLVWSSWLGGHDAEAARGGIALVPDGGLAVGSGTTSPDFPGSSPPDNWDNPDWGASAFVTKIDGRNGTPGGDRPAYRVNAGRVSRRPPPP